ncbi:MAG: hypothetical protein PHT69_01585 [Bacteroidales bacterium]|nr:hypothetical protein [Bacteroidales bacterium]
MKSKDKKKQPTFEEDYNKIMKDFIKPNSPIPQTPQWTNPSDFIVKFSLYQETPNSITSTNTFVNIG